MAPGYVLPIDPNIQYVCSTSRVGHTRGYLDMGPMRRMETKRSTRFVKVNAPVPNGHHMEGGSRYVRYD